MTAAFAAGSALLEPREVPRQPDPAERWQLVTRAQAGDRDAFADLYRLYHPRIYRYVFHRCGGHRQLAEDLTADVFVRALRNIDRVAWQGLDPAAWLTTIARNLVADHFKSHRYRREITTGDMLDADRADRDPQADPAAAVVDHHRNLTLLAAVKQLRTEQQECIRLRFLCGLSVAETAAAMGKNVNAIKALQHRAIGNLARILRLAGEAAPC